MRYFQGLAAGLAVALVAVLITHGLMLRSPVKSSAETIYVVNKAPQYISDKQIEQDIPAWETAANRDFAPAWGTPQVKLELVNSVPAGAVSAVFEKSGPIQGALAYHNVRRGVPQIIIYAGVADFYGFSNSVSFTHELFEMLADRDINTWSWHWESQYPRFYVGSAAFPLPRGAIWFNEVSDPVEDITYAINGVPISDFITPNWFGEHVNGPYDEVNAVHEPFQVLRGGYAQFQVGNVYHEIVNFRGAGRDAAGFEKAESH